MSFNTGSRDNDTRYQQWAKDVKIRDNYTCQICGKRGSKIHSHHVNSWDKFPEIRYEIDNGVTLCNLHHDEFHRLYGCGNNTEIQFAEFKIIMETFKKIAKNKIDTKKNDKQ